MGRFDEIKNKINANINENGEQRITGQVLNEVLIDEVNTIDEVITELEESIGQGGGGGITEEKEVYIGTQPTEDAKLWIDPTGTPSGGGGNSGGSNVFVFPEEVLSDDYTEESPYSFTPEKTAEFLAALENPSSVYVAYQNAGGYIASLHFNIHTVYGFDAVCVSYAMGYLSVLIIHMMVEDDTVKAYKETQLKQL